MSNEDDSRAGSAPVSGPGPAFGSKGILAGWLCLAAGVYVMIASLDDFFVYGPLFLLTFVLGIVAIARRRVGAGVLLLLAVLALPPVLALGAVAARLRSPAADASHSLTAEPRSIPMPAPVVEPGDQWTYNQSEDPMGGTTYTASVISTNAVNFDFPYSGEQHAVLGLRTHPRHGRDVILRIERGQFLCRSYDGCSVLVRFDDGAAHTFSASGASDNSTEVLFIQEYSRFVERMRNASRVRISAEVYQEGSPVFEFDVRGFSVARYKPKS